MGAPKAGDRDHACQMAQSGFKSVENTNNTNQTFGDAEQVGGILLVVTAKRQQDRGVVKTILGAVVKLDTNRNRRSTASSDPVHEIEK